MSTRILKYEFDISHATSVIRRTPAVFEVKMVGTQRPHHICLWAEVWTGIEGSSIPPEVERTFHVVATGEDVPTGWRYLGTAFDGPFVWHVYEVQS